MPNETGPRSPETLLPGDEVSSLVATPAEVRVTYAEVDKMGVAYYGHYLRWFEIGRAEYLRARGRPYSEIESEGLKLPVIEAYVRYREPALYDDLLEIRTVPTGMHPVRVTFGYRVQRKTTGALLAEGYSVHACQGPSGRVRRFPPELLRLLRQPPLPGGPAERAGGDGGGPGGRTGSADCRKPGTGPTGK